MNFKDPKFIGTLVAVAIGIAGAFLGSDLKSYVCEVPAAAVSK